MPSYFAGLLGPNLFITYKNSPAMSFRCAGLLMPNVFSKNQNLLTKSFRWHSIVGLGPSPTWVQTHKRRSLQGFAGGKKRSFGLSGCFKRWRSRVHAPRPLQHSHLVFVWLSVVLNNNNSRSSKIWIIAHSCLCFMTCAHCFIEFWCLKS
jgi:hypothetical protein